MPPRVKRPKTYHHGNLAEELVRVSLELVEEQGSTTFSLRDAAARCGVVVSSAYKHYASKAELLYAVADVGFAQLGEQMSARAAAASREISGASVAAKTARAEARLVAIGRAYVQFAREHPHLFRLMFGPDGPKGGGTDARPNAPAHQLTAILVEEIEGVLSSHGRTLDRIEPLKVIAWSLVHGFSMMLVDGVLAPPNKRAFAELIDELGEAVLRSLR